MNPRTIAIGDIHGCSTAGRRHWESTHSVVDVPTIGLRSIIILGEIVERHGFWFPDLSPLVIKR